MSGGQATNDQAVQFQQQQAADAQAKEQLRQQHLNQGMDAINKIFSGSPVMATTTTPYDWSQFNTNIDYQHPTTDPATGYPNYGPSGVPAGYTAVQVPKRGTGGAAQPAAITAGGQSYALPQGFTRDPNTGALVPPSAPAIGAFSYGGTSYNPDGTVATGGGAGGTEWALQDASGKTYYQGDPLNITSTYDTGKRTGGFDDNYFNNLRQQYLNLYQPDEARQYQEALRDLNYNLANQGISRSSMAADKQGELAYNDQLASAKIVADASNYEQSARDQVNQEKQSVINQLYSTEDPTLAADLAQSSASSLNLKTPTFTPGAQLFGPALTAVASGISSYAYPGVQPTPYGAYPTQQPGNVASASSSSGKPYL